MKKIKMMTVFTVIALATSFAGNAQTTKPATQKASGSKEQAVAPAKQKESATSTSATTAKPKTTTSATAVKPKTTATHKTHKKTAVSGTAKPVPASTVKPKTNLAPSNHFARNYSHTNNKMLKGKHKKGMHHKNGGAKAPSGNK